MRAPPISPALKAQASELHVWGNGAVRRLDRAEGPTEQVWASRGNLGGRGAVLLGLPLLLTLDSAALSGELLGARVTIADAAMLGLAVVTLIGVHVRPRVASTAAVGWLCMFAALGLLSATLNSATGGHVIAGHAIADTLRYLLYGAVLYAVSCQLSTRRELIPLYAAAWLIAGVFLATIGIVQFIAISLGIEVSLPWLGKVVGSRVSGTMRWQGSYVAFLALTLPLAAYFSAGAAAWGPALRRLGRFGIAVIIVGLIASGSRAVLLAAPFLLLSLLVPGSQRSRAWGAIVALLMIVGLGLAWTNTSLPQDSELQALQRNLDRIAQSGDLGQEPVDEARLAIWREAIGAWQERPVLGVGASQSVSDRNGTLMATHNSYVATLLQRGSLGVAWLVLGVGLLFHTAWRSFRRSQRLSRDSGGDRLPQCVVLGLLAAMALALSANTLEYRMVWLFLPIFLESHQIRSEAAG